jgi:4-oxalocrotonate tautomerase
MIAYSFKVFSLAYLSQILIKGKPMPIINIKISQAPNPALARSVSDAILDLTASLLGKPRHITAITVSFVPPEHWFIAGISLAELRKNSFYFDIKVSDSTNTKIEKAAYIAACFDAMNQLLTPLHQESYIFVHDVRADAYGYGGLTQEYRYVANQLKAS